MHSTEQANASRGTALSTYQPSKLEPEHQSSHQLHSGTQEICRRHVQARPCGDGVCFLCGYGICMNGSACVGGGMRVIHALGVRCRTSRRMRRPHARPEPRPGGRARHIWCNRTNARDGSRRLWLLPSINVSVIAGNGTGEASGEHAEKPGEGARPDGR